MSKEPAISKVEQNRATLARWYDDMWGQCNFALVPEIAAPKYLRHDITGANNLMTSQEYSDMIAFGLSEEHVTAFSYFLIAEGDYVASLGRYLLTRGRQWDWVQLFRLENAAMVETWLPGMGGTDIFGFPQAHNVWTGGELPEPLPLTTHKQFIKDYYEQVFVQQNEQAASRFLADQLRVHDNTSADSTLSPEEYYQRMRVQIDGKEISEFKLFMIEEGDMVVAAGSWKIDKHRQWDWVQAFQIADNKIVRTWLPAIGGDDTSLQHIADNAWPLHAMPDNSIRVDTN